MEPFEPPEGYGMDLLPESIFGQRFNIGVNVRPTTRRRPVQRAVILNPPIQFTFQKPWEERIKTLADPGKIRLLTKPVIPIIFEKYWYADMSLTEWIHIIDSLKKEQETNALFRTLNEPDIVDRVTAIFEGNQKARWLAQWALQRWKLRVWSKRTQCNVDMIDMAEIKDRDAIFLTDTNQRQIFRFHRRDMYNNLIANICMSDEMMPYPRIPTNPWTNVKLTLVQIISLCSQLCMDYAKRGACPPVLLAAFCAARYNLKRFQQDNASMLSQHAIYSYFKDLTIDNQTTVYDTIVQLLTDAALRFSPAAIGRWLRQTQQTPLHHDWLLMVRDYTVYMNLHVQVRPTWLSDVDIRRDVRALYGRTTTEMPREPRIRVVPTMHAQFLDDTANALNELLNIHGGEPMESNLALLLIGNTLFR